MRRSSATRKAQGPHGILHAQMLRKIGFSGIARDLGGSIIKSYHCHTPTRRFRLSINCGTVFARINLSAVNLWSKALTLNEVNMGNKV